MCGGSCFPHSLWGSFPLGHKGPACSSEASVCSLGSLTLGHPDSRPGAGAVQASGCQSAGVRVLHGHRQASCLQPHHLQEVAAPCHLHSRDREPGLSPGPRGSHSPGLFPRHTAAASHPPPQPPLTAARSCTFSAREPPSQEQLRSFKAPDGPCVGAGLCVHTLIPPLPPQASAPPTKALDPGFLDSAEREGHAGTAPDRQQAPGKR